MGFTLKDAVEIGARGAREGAALSIGLTLLVFQQAQVRRREATEASSKLLHSLGSEFGERLKLIEERLDDLNERTNNSAS